MSDIEKALVQEHFPKSPIRTLAPQLDTSFDTMSIQAGIRFLFAKTPINKAFPIPFINNRLYGDSKMVIAEPVCFFSYVLFNEGSGMCILSQGVCTSSQNWSLLSKREGSCCPLFWREGGLERSLRKNVSGIFFGLWFRSTFYFGCKRRLEIRTGGLPDGDCVSITKSRLVSAASSPTHGRFTHIIMKIGKIFY